MMSLDVLIIFNTAYSKIDYNSLVLLMLLIVALYFWIRQFMRGAFTGNEYKKIDGVLWVKHPGSDRWERLSDHMERQKRLRDNK